jgi:hypothetical protein
MPKSPVFIVGSPRSGTSALAKALLSIGYQGFHEGNFLPLLSVIQRAVDRHIEVYGKPSPHVLAARVDSNELKSRIAEIFKEVADNWNTGPLWFDKSGNVDMIRAIPTLRHLWPDSVYLFAKRRAIENVVSRVKKFPLRDFEYHCVDWVKNMAAWREIRQEIPAEAYLEVDQQDLIRDTDAISAKIAGLLQLERAQAEKLAKTFKLIRPQETTKGSAEKLYSLDSLGWSDAERAIFEQHCIPEMKIQGYGEDAEYYRKA